MAARNGDPFKSVSVNAANKAMSSRLHFHACRTCRFRYSCNCQEASENGTCISCRTHHERPLWDRNSDPQACCLIPGACQQVIRGQELIRYDLAGPGPWYMCRTCHRAHGFIPKKESA